MVDSSHNKNVGLNGCPCETESLFLYEDKTSANQCDTYKCNVQFNK